jgi:hypothetical protein
MSRLQTVYPLLIDHFLAWNESLRPIGKLLIAAVILECEAKRSVRDGGWYRFLVHKLVYGCSESADILRNNVRFITFNYDASLENYLFAALTSLDILNQNHAQVVYILGYGFDTQNNRRIGLDPILRTSNKAVMFTNFGHIPAINKKASKLFFGNHDEFLSKDTVGGLKDRYFEKSGRNVYEVLRKILTRLKESF